MSRLRLKATLLQRLRGVSCAIAALLSSACTEQGVANSPAGKVAPPGVESSLLQLGPAQEVVDPLGRWASQLEVSSEVELRDEPGFVQLVLPAPEGVSLNCFVYEMSLDTGQAVLRFLRAVSSGLRFLSFELQGVQAANGSPVLSFSGAYEAERAGGRSGVLSMMISPRIQFPVMCTHDGPVRDPAFEHIAEAFLEAFRLRKEVERALLLSEIWALESEQKLLGFSWFQSYEGEGQVVSNLSLAATFVWSEHGPRTTDSAAVEIEDEQGVSQGRWLISEGTQKLVELSLKRHSKAENQTTFRFFGELEGQAVAGDFELDGVLRSARFLDQALALGSEGALVEAQSWFQYMPEFSSSGPTSIRLTPTSSEHVLLERGPSRMELYLGEDHRPLRKTLYLNEPLLSEKSLRFKESPGGKPSENEKAAPPLEARLLQRGP